VELQRRLQRNVNRIKVLQEGERVHSSKAREGPSHGDKSARGARVKSFTVRLQLRIKIVIQNLNVFYQRLEKQVKVEIVKILSYFQEEMV